MIGHTWQSKENFGASTSGPDGVAKGSAGITDDRRALVEPIEFARLRRGGPQNGNQVETIIYRGGQPFQATGMNHMRVRFSQEVG